MAADSTAAGGPSGSAAECAVEEAGHLLASDDGAWTEAAGGAAAGDARLGEAVNGAFVHRAVVIAEPVARGRGQMQGASEEARHLAAADEPAWAVAQAR